MKNKTYIDIYQISDTQYQINSRYIDLEKLDYEGALDACDFVAESYEEQCKKVEKCAEVLQNSRNKATGLQLLAQKLAAIADKLEPVKRVYLLTDPRTYTDTTPENADFLISTGLWSYTGERVTEILPLTADYSQAA